MNCAQGQAEQSRQSDQSGQRLCRNHRPTHATCTSRPLHRHYRQKGTSPSKMWTPSHRQTPSYSPAHTFVSLSGGWSSSSSTTSCPARQSPGSSRAVAPNLP
eukprot:7375916-Prymnesium_polylepis.2